MKLVAVSVVKNEADVIEAFVRHTCAWVDHHLVFDHDSTDGTREILAALLREGLSLSVYTDDQLGKLQQARSNHLTRLAAAELGADWIFPLDADEFLTGPGRPALEKTLASLVPSTPASLRMLNYYSTATDDPAQINPVLRLTHCERNQGHTIKVAIPAPLALETGVTASMGSHTLQRETREIPATPLPPEFQLAHFPLRSPSQEAKRIVLAELQKLSRGRAHAGLDLHYRLAFQLLMENPELFFAISRQPLERLQPVPLAYLGGPLRHTTATPEWTRLIRALLPYLEKLAASHGELLDRVAASQPGKSIPSSIRRLDPNELSSPLFAGRDDAYHGFTPLDGWGPREGPVAESYLPVFHWGNAPVSHLLITCLTTGSGRLDIEALTYAADQRITVELNGTTLGEYVFPRVNQRERLNFPLPLSAGENHLRLHYSTCLQTAYDPRKLAVIYLSLRITQPTGAVGIQSN